MIINGMQRFFYAIAIFVTFMAVMWIRIRMGPLLALCLAGPLLFIAAIIAGYYVSRDETPHDGLRDERK